MNSVALGERQKPVSSDSRRPPSRRSGNGDRVHMSRTELAYDTRKIPTGKRPIALHS